MPDTTTHPQDCSSKTLEHLGQVAGMCDELGIVELIDTLIPQDLSQRNVSAGQAVKAMILNGQGFARRALCQVPRFFQDKPAERLLGEGIAAEHLNGDALGRALDAIFECNPSDLFTSVSLQAAIRLGLSCRFGHPDASGFHVDGQYNSIGGAEEGVIRIAKGYSRDHRPDLNLAVLLPICGRQAGIPLLTDALSGNNSDKESFRETVQARAGLPRADFGMERLIAGGALHTVQTLRQMSNFLWISRVPETLNAACDVIRAAAPEQMDDPARPACRSLGILYGDVRQRRIAVYSPEAYQRARKTAGKRCLKQSAAEYKAFRQLCGREFACEADALKAPEAFKKKLKMTFVTDVKATALPRFKGKGRPAQGREPDFYICRVAGGLASGLSERTRLPERKSRFIQAACRQDQHESPDEEMIAACKDRQKAERGFRFLKDPMFMASTLFPESPKRIMALMMAMTLCLLVYAALEYRIREALKEESATFPDRKGKPVEKPTARRVFQFFSGIHVLIIGKQQELILNSNEHHLFLAQLPGERYENLYSGYGG